MVIDKTRILSSGMLVTAPSLTDLIQWRRTTPAEAFARPIYKYCIAVRPAMKILHKILHRILTPVIIISPGECLDQLFVAAGEV